MTKLPDEGHELFRSFRVVFGLFLEIVHADKRQEDEATRECCPTRCHLGALGVLRHLTYQFNSRLHGDTSKPFVKGKRSRSFLLSLLPRIEHRYHRLIEIAPIACHNR